MQLTDTSKHLYTPSVPANSVTNYCYSFFFFFLYNSPEIIWSFKMCKRYIFFFFLCFQFLNQAIFHLFSHLKILYLMNMSSNELRLFS